MRIITVCNQKGGVGKTAISLHLAMAAVETGKRTLLIDIDSQGNASSLMTGDMSIVNSRGGAEDLFSGKPEPVSTRTGVDLLHGHKHLDAVDSRSDFKTVVGLKSLLTTLPYDVVIIDTPPSAGVRQIAALAWADHVVIPVEPAESSVSGLIAVKLILEKLRKNNPFLEETVVVNRMVKASASQRQIVAKLEEKANLMKPVLSGRVSVADALKDGVPVWQYKKAPSDVQREWQEAAYKLLGAPVEAKADKEVADVAVSA